jgi:hypothetical protein
VTQATVSATILTRARNARKVCEADPSRFLSLGLQQETPAVALHNHSNRRYDGVTLVFMIVLLIGCIWDRIRSSKKETEAIVFGDIEQWKKE